MSIRRKAKAVFNIIILFTILSLLFSPIRPIYGADLAVDDFSFVPGATTCLNFSDLVAGQSVEGLGTVHPLLNISSTGNTVAIFEGDSIAAAYGAPNPAADLGSSILNNGLGPNGGFIDLSRLHEYSFSFAPGVTVEYFSIKMYDFGDFNPYKATEHKVELVGYSENEEIVNSSVLQFTSDAGSTPTSGSAGNLQLTGDAFTALPQEPGNFTFNVNGSGMTRLQLQFSHNNSESFQSSDPNIGLAVLCFQPEGELNTNLCVDFVAVQPGASVEGLGTLHPDLNIATSGNAVAIHQGDSTAAGFGAPNPSANLGSSILNNGVGDLGGFVDLERIHDYQFSFAPGVSVDFFAVKMLDFGDFNPMKATEHAASLLAYNASDELVSINELSFTSDAVSNPTTGSAGNLQLTGDAVTAKPQEPGNFTFTVSGSGITRLEMRFSNNVSTETVASDPNIGLAVLCFVPETFDVPDVPADSTCMDFAALPAGASVEGLGVLHPALNINSSGNAVSIQEGDATAAGYGAPNPSAGLGVSVLNNGVGPLGGFVDLSRIHEYEFSFAPGSSVTFFAVKMLDFGDFNPVQATEHSVSLIGYDADNETVDIDTLSFTSDASSTPTTGSAGNLQFSGDAITALPQEPGNFVFSVEGSGITRLAMSFTNDTATGHNASDPNLAMAVLCFVVEEDDTPELDPPTAELTLVRTKPAPEIGGKYNVTYACSETAPNLVSATINGYDVINGQDVMLVVREHESARIVDGVLVWLFAPEFSLDVTCADDIGNEVSASVAPELIYP